LKSQWKISMLIVLNKPLVGVFLIQKISDFLLRKNSNLRTVLSYYTISLTAPCVVSSISDWPRMCLASVSAVFWHAVLLAYCQFVCRLGHAVKTPRHRAGRRHEPMIGHRIFWICHVKKITMDIEGVMPIAHSQHS